MEQLRQRVRVALAALEDRSLEAQAAWSLRLMLESLPSRPLVHAGYLEVLHGAADTPRSNAQPMMSSGWHTRMHAAAHDGGRRAPHAYAGLERCGRAAARARLVVLQQALDCHGGHVLGAQAAATVQALVVYLRAQHQHLHVDEAANLAAAVMQCLLPEVAKQAAEQARQLSQPHPPAAQRAAGDAPLTAQQLVQQLCKPLLKVAVRSVTPL